MRSGFAFGVKGLDTLSFVFLSAGWGGTLEVVQSQHCRAVRDAVGPREENPSRLQVFGTVFALFP